MPTVFGSDHSVRAFQVHSIQPSYRGAANERKTRLWHALHNLLESWTDSKVIVCWLRSARMSVSSSQETASAGLLPSQRYMGVNRFSTRGGIAGAQWEEQWTHREYNMLVSQPGWRSVCVTRTWSETFLVVRIGAALIRADSPAQARTGFRVSSLLRRTDLGGKVQYGDDGQVPLPPSLLRSKQ